MIVLPSRSSVVDRPPAGVRGHSGQWPRLSANASSAVMSCWLAALMTHPAGSGGKRPSDHDGEPGGPGMRRWCTS